MSNQLADLLVEGTVVGTPYRKLLCYDLTSINSLSCLKAQVLNDLKAAGAPLGSECEVVLRNYHLSDYEHTSINSEGAKSCALSDRGSVGSGPRRHSRLLAAAPSPRVPIGPADDGQQTMNAIASRQLYDRACGGGSVLPLEARVKPLAPSPADRATTSGPLAAGAQTTGAQTNAPAPCRTADSQPFDITVRDFRGRSHTVRVCGGTSVGALKQGIAGALGCSVVSHWRLFHAGRPLTDDLDLADYNVTAGSVIDVQMTSQQTSLLPAAPNATAGAKEASGCPRTSNSGGIGASVLGSPGDRSPGNHLMVQVLLPCGRVVNVPRSGSEEVALFFSRVLEAQKALLVPAPAGAERAEAGAAATAVPTAAFDPALRSRVFARAAGATGPPPPMELFVSGQACSAGVAARRSARDLKGVIGHKLLAILLAAAAVVMAMAVL